MKLMKLYSFLLMGVMLSTSMLFTSCSEDDDTDPLVGTYAFTLGTMINTTNVVFPSATSIGTIAANDQTTTTLIIGQGLYASSPCATATNARTELRADGTLWNVCAGGDAAEAQQGAWVIDAGRTQLTLTVTVEGVGSLDIVLSGFVDNGVTITGRIENFPLGLDLNYALGSVLPSSSPMFGLPSNPNNINFQPIVVDVVFTRTSL